MHTRSTENYLATCRRNSKKLTRAGTTRRTTGLFIGLCAGAMSIGAIAAGPLTVEEALVSVYQTNPTLLAAREQLRVTNEQRPVALAAFLPKLSVTGSHAEAHSKARSGATESASTSYGFSAELTLFKSGANLAALDIAELTIQSQRVQLFKTEQTVLLSGITAFANVVRDRQIVTFRETNVANLVIHQVTTKKLFDVKRRTVTDLAQSNSRLASARADLARARGNLTTALAAFQEVFGFDPDELVPFEVPGEPTETLESLRTLGSTANVDVVIARYVKAIARKQLRQRQAGLGPTASVGHSWSKSVSDTRNTSSDQSTGGTTTFSLSIPIFQGGSNHTQVRQAALTIKQRDQEVDVALRSADKTTVEQYTSLLSNLATLVSLRIAVKNAKDAVNGVKRELELGRRTLLDLLDLERDLVNNQISLVQGETTSLVAAFTLQQAVGMLGAKDLALKTDLYDPEADYQKRKWKIFGLSPD